ncbi:hypothetical protein DFP72DRAFT_816796, partial [Ephemerocybe angulata]
TTMSKRAEPDPRPSKVTQLRNLGLFVLVFSTILYGVAYLPFFGLRKSTPSSLLAKIAGNSSLPSSGISVVDQIYVISLKTRSDRREQMDILAGRLGLHWTYLDAVPANDLVVEATLNWVRKSRARSAAAMTEDSTPITTTDFQWPMDIDSLTLSDEYISYWYPTDPASLDDDLALFNGSNSPIPVATQNNNIASSIVGLPAWMLLTGSRIACWHSHLSVIHSAANTPGGTPRATLVLEDDVDMEQDINAQLSQLWTYLPPDWDVVFLGHCWSNESSYPAISGLSETALLHNHSHALSSPGDLKLDVSASHHLHPSFAPKCTHAYALSRKGARKLLLHLRYPPFSFSRAIDQAMAWLVQSGRLKSFSVVPALVVQRKLLKSDIKGEDGNSRNGTKSGMGTWKVYLTDGVFGETGTVD